MEVKLNLYKSDVQGGANGAIFASYPFKGNHNNTGDRYQTLADLTEHDVYGFEGFGLGQEAKDKDIQTIKNMLWHPGDFNEGLAESLDKVRNRYNNDFIALSETIGHYTVSQFVAAELMPVRGIVVRDGINNKAPQPQAIGEGNYAIYDLAKEKRRPDFIKEDLKPMRCEPEPKLNVRDQLRLWKNEVFGHAAQWRSPYGQNLARGLAKMKNTPLYVVNFEHTFTGDVQSAEKFCRELAVIRGVGEAGVAGFAWKTEPDSWHSDIRYKPSMTARNIREMLELPQAN